MEKAALNLLEVVDHAIHLQSPRPGTWQEGCSAGLDLERRFMNLEGSFSEGGREATRTARTTMLRQKSTDHVSQYCPHEKVFSNAPMLFWAITCVCVCVCVSHSVHGILWARILEWVAMPFPRGSSPSWIKPVSPAFAGGFFIAVPPGKP